MRRTRLTNDLQIQIFRLEEISRAAEVIARDAYCANLIDISEFENFTNFAAKLRSEIAREFVEFGALLK